MGKTKKVTYKLDVDTKKGQKGISDLNKGLDTGAKKGKTFGSSLTGGFSAAKMGWLALGAAIITGVKKMLSSMIGFEKASARLASVLGKSKESIGDLTNMAKRLGATTKYTATQVLGLAESLARLGFTSDEIQNMAEPVLNLATALDTDLAPAAELAGSTIRAFGLETADTNNVVDILAKSTTISALSFQKLETSLPIVGAVAKQAGSSLELVTAQLGELANNGLDASTSATGLRNIYLELAKKGLTWEQAMQKINNASDKSAEAMALFGKRSATTALILSKGAKSVALLESSLLRAGGATEQMAREQLNTLDGALTILSSSWDGLMLSFNGGNAIMTTIAKGIRKVSDAFSWLTKLITGSTAVKALKAEQIELMGLESQLRDTNTTEEERMDIILRLQEQYPDFLGNIDAETIKNEGLFLILEKVNEQLVNKILLQREDDKLSAQIEETADAKYAKLEQEKELREEMNELLVKHNLHLSGEGTLLEQANAVYTKLYKAQKTHGGILLDEVAAFGHESYILTILNSQYETSKNKLDALTKARNEFAKSLGLGVKDREFQLLEVEKRVTIITNEMEIRRANRNISIYQQELKDKLRGHKEYTQSLYDFEMATIDKIEKEKKRKARLAREKGSKEYEAQNKKLENASSGRQQPFDNIGSEAAQAPLLNTVGVLKPQIDDWVNDVSSAFNKLPTKLEKTEYNLALNIKNILKTIKSITKNPAIDANGIIAPGTMKNIQNKMLDISTAITKYKEASRKELKTEIAGNDLKVEAQKDYDAEIKKIKGDAEDKRFPSPVKSYSTIARLVTTDAEIKDMVKTGI